MDPIPNARYPSAGITFIMAIFAMSIGDESASLIRIDQQHYHCTIQSIAFKTTVSFRVWRPFLLPLLKKLQKSSPILTNFSV